jgi:hypothetical protein
MSQKSFAKNFFKLMENTNKYNYNINKLVQNIQLVIKVIFNINAN